MDETCKSYIISYCGNLFKNYRNKMKTKYYDPYNTDEKRLRHCSWIKMICIQIYNVISKGLLSNP